MIKHEIPNQENELSISFELPTGSLHRLINLTLLAVTTVMIFTISTSLLTLQKNKELLALSAPPAQPAQNLEGEVLAEETDLSETEELTVPEIPPLPTAAPTPAKASYTIAIIGDSMVDTMGERLEYLEAALLARYPQVKFTLYNYGVGSQTVTDGLARISSPLRHMDRTYPAIAEVKPDIIIVGSFGYNPYTPHDRDKHWLELTRLVQYSQSLTKQVYMLAEIAPLRRGFGAGPMGVNWSPDTVYTHTGHIVEQLQNVIGLAKTLKVPLIDTFVPSVTDANFSGTESYVNVSDHIHPSVQGHTFMADKIAGTIELK